MPDERLKKNVKTAYLDLTVDFCNLVKARLDEVDPEWGEKTHEELIPILVPLLDETVKLFPPTLESFFRDCVYTPELGVVI